MAQPITRGLVEDLLARLDLPDPVVEFGALQVEPGQRADLRDLFAGRSYVGTDYRDGPGVDRVEDLRALSFADASVGTAICLDTLEHCEDPPQACRELGRVVAPGGVCVIASVMLFGIHAYPGDFFRFTPEGFRSMLAGGGFDDVRVVGVGDPAIPREVFAIGAKGRSLGALDLAALPTVARAQAGHDDPGRGVPVGPLKVPPRELGRLLARELPRTLRARARAKRRRRGG